MPDLSAQGPILIALHDVGNHLDEVTQGEPESGDLANLVDGQWSNTYSASFDAGYLLNEAVYSILPGDKAFDVANALLGI